MSTETQLYPLRFAPIFQYRLWGGRRFEHLLSEPLPGDGPIGEAWILSDRDDYPSLVADGPLAGAKIGDLIRSQPDGVLGRYSGRYSRFPLLLKFLDAREMLSVQVHPSDRHPELLPPGENGKTEAWVVLESDPGSEIYAGLEPGATPQALAHLDSSTSDKFLAKFHPKVGDGLFIPAGTVHALGGGVAVFEVQQNSDVTFRLFDWDRVDASTGKPRELHIDKALQCIDYERGPVGPVTPIRQDDGSELLFDTTHFKLWRHQSSTPFMVGARDEPRVVVGASGGGEITTAGHAYRLRQGDVFLLPAEVGEVQFTPSGLATVFDIGFP